MPFKEAMAKIEYYYYYYFLLSFSKSLEVSFLLFLFFYFSAHRNQQFWLPRFEWVWCGLTAKLFDSVLKCFVRYVFCWCASERVDFNFNVAYSCCCFLLCLGCSIIGVVFSFLFAALSHSLPCIPLFLAPIRCFYSTYTLTHDI